jgi:hypothetical protein
MAARGPVRRSAVVKGSGRRRRTDDALQGSGVRKPPLGGEPTFVRPVSLTERSQIVGFLCCVIQEWCSTDWLLPTLSGSVSAATPQAGAPSGYCGSPSLSVSHACLLEVQMCSVGWKSSGISKLPHVKPITPALARSVNNEVPQTVQKPRTRTGEELRRPSAPVIVTAFKGISTRALNAAPSDR